MRENLAKYGSYVCNITTSNKPSTNMIPTSTGIASGFMLLKSILLFFSSFNDRTGISEGWSGTTALVA
jgi:hypothetical protein